MSLNWNEVCAGDGVDCDETLADKTDVANAAVALQSARKEITLKQIQVSKTQVAAVHLDEHVALAMSPEIPEEEGQDN